MMQKQKKQEQLLSNIADVPLRVDMTPLYARAQRKGIPTFPLLIHVISWCINQLCFFKMYLNQNGEPLSCKQMNPAYLVYDARSDGMSCLCSPFYSDFHLFYEDYTAHVQAFLAQKEPLFDQLFENTFFVSSVRPGSFYSIMRRGTDADFYRRPLFFIEKRFDADNRCEVLLRIHLHSSTARLFQSSSFLTLLKTRINTCKTWL